MVTRELIRREVEKVKDDHLELLYKIIKIFETHPGSHSVGRAAQLRKAEESDWHAFVARTYGCLADDPITRGDQGQYGIREAMG